MKKFFVPSAWGKHEEAIKFETINGNLSGPTKASESKPKKKKNKQKPKRVKPAKEKSQTPTANTTNTPKIKSGRIEKPKNAKKQQKQKLQLTPALSKAAAETANARNSAATFRDTTATAANALETKLKEQLMGGRFRYLNEQLYTIDSKEADELFREDRDAFSAYHAGYRCQVEKWPLNPVERIAKSLRRLPKSLEIGDFGCGEGKLAQLLPNKVHSMDLVSLRDDIIACDMANTPLQAQTLDVAVYCLSLMGTNLNEYLLEANRVLKLDGLVYIAEIQSRFDDVQQFVRCMQAAGFELVKKDVSVKLFFFFQFKKVRHVGKVAILPPLTLKPCLYRKR